ncbi:MULTISPECIES: hypothetical protein [Synechococcus]|uniref:hypothetical protein n=1 Tax=Synechococcus TaxID=1129 RepID=UPI0020CBB559|nr:hypothetical protein [Synechococcus lacustris]MCF8135309.1 hypothetical protein [Synechococcus lacustris]MCP9810446.1 hypothetical protein [Synechococcus lacustris Maggiore-St4-Slac]MCP9812924.1 hypothetical protein [Synechococcus lacustris L1E-Slac]
MTRPDPSFSSQTVFNNPDGFAMAFSDAWQALHKENLSREQCLEQVMQQLADHPFLLQAPAQAKELAAFRMRLLGY